MTKAQPIAAMVEAFRRARQHPALRGAVLELYGHLGFFPTDRTAILELMAAGGYRPDDDAVVYRGPVSKLALTDVYAKADALVFLAGGGRYVTSGKIFEYMATGKPIVSVHQPGIAAEEVLAGYPLWQAPGALSVDDIAGRMVAAGEAARSATAHTRAQARAWADRYERRALLEPLTARLRAVAGRPAAPAGDPAPTSLLETR